MRRTACTLAAAALALLAAGLPHHAEPAAARTSVADGLEGRAVGAPPPRPTTEQALVFQERFDGTRLERRRWIPCYPWWSGEGCEHLVNGELQWYWPRGNVVADGHLAMTAEEHRIRGEDEDGDPHWFDYVSGMATTAGKFEFTYGYVEIEARVPAGRGLWPALWMLSVDCCAPEVDIMENLGQRPRKMYFTYHRSYREEPIGTSVTGVSRGWHTYAVDWKPGSVTWYLDGERVHHVDEAPSEPMYLLLNLAVGGDWPGPPDESTEFPATFDVRSVKVWQ